MTQPPYQQMAKEFLDIWQKQLASVMSDKQFIQSMLELIKSMQMPHVDTKQKSSAASHPSDAPDAHDGLHAQLAYRLAMCERRIAELEKTAGRSTGKSKTAKKPARGSKKPKQ